ncbi:32975_t:CDS:2, partial [Racocetra persica]
MPQQKKTRESKYQNISFEKRKKIIDDVNNKGISIRKVAANYRLAPSTVDDIVKRFDREDQIALKSRGGDKRSILNEQHKEFLRDAIEEEPWLAICDLTQKLLSRFPDVKLSDRTVFRYVKDLGFTLKRLTVVPEGHNTDKTIYERKQYVKKIYDENINIYKDMIYMDETGFNLHLSASRGRAYRRQLAIHEVVSNRGKKISIIAAMNEDGVLYYKSILGSANSKIFSDFIRELINNISNSKFLVMDNIMFHRSNIVKEAVKNTKHKILYLPSYSPFLNPIENWFSKIKNSISRNRLRDTETILSRFDEAVNTVTDEDCKEWIRYTSSYFQRCLN